MKIRTIIDDIVHLIKFLGLFDCLIVRSANGEMQSRKCPFHILGLNLGGQSFVNDYCKELYLDEFIVIFMQEIIDLGAHGCEIRWV